MYYCLSIDLGTKKTAAVITSFNSDKKVKILSFASELSKGMMHGTIHTYPLVFEVLKKVVRSCIATSSVEVTQIKKILIGIAGKHTQINITKYSKKISNSNGKVKEEDYYDFLKMPALNSKIIKNQEFIGAFPHDIKINDFEKTKNPVGMQADKISGKFLEIWGYQNAVSDILKCCSDLRLDTGLKKAEHQLLLEPLASLLAVLNEQEKEEGVMLVDIGGGTTDVAVIHDETLVWSSILPLGGDEVTKDIKKKFNTTFEKSENLKIVYSDLYVKESEIFHIPIEEEGNKTSHRKITSSDLNEVVLARYYEYARFCYEELKNLPSHVKVGKIVMCGGGALQKNVAPVFEKCLNIPVFVCKIKENLFDTLPNELDSPKYATLLGLALQHYHNDFIVVDQIFVDQNGTQRKKKPVVGNILEYIQSSSIRYWRRAEEKVIKMGQRLFDTN